MPVSGSVGRQTNQETQHVELRVVLDAAKSEGQDCPDDLLGVSVDFLFREKIWFAYLQRGNVDGRADPRQQNVAGNLADDVSNREGGHGVVQLIAVHVEVFLPAWLSDFKFTRELSTESAVGNLHSRHKGIGDVGLIQELGEETCSNMDQFTFPGLASMM